MALPHCTELAPASVSPYPRKPKQTTLRYNERNKKKKAEWIWCFLCSEWTSNHSLKDGQHGLHCFSSLTKLLRMSEESNGERVTVSKVSASCCVSQKNSIPDKYLAPSLHFYRKYSGATFKLFLLQQSLTTESEAKKQTHPCPAEKLLCVKFY